MDLVQQPLGITRHNPNPKINETKGALGEMIGWIPLFQHSVGEESYPVLLVRVLEKIWDRGGSVPRYSS
jgi:hypothetical protein